MNSIYKKVHRFAIQMMNAVDEENTETFTRLYAELKALCEKHQNTEQDHPAQWEALADFSEDFSEASSYYQLACELAVQQELRDYIASINYSWALMLQQQSDTENAVIHAQTAFDAAKGSPDKALVSDIKQLLTALK